MMQITLEQRLELLSSAGDVTLAIIRDGRSNDGWYAIIKMTVHGHGENFKIHTEFGFSSASAAISQLEDRVTECVRKMATAVGAEIRNPQGSR